MGITTVRKITTILLLSLILLIPTLSRSDSSLSSEDLKYIGVLQNKGVLPNDVNLNNIKHEDIVKSKQMFGKLYGLDSQSLESPDPQFSSPLKTWQLYKQALQSGNIELALSCLTPVFAERQADLLKAVEHKNKLQEMAELFSGPIQAIKQDDNSAKYRHRRKEIYGGKEIELTDNIYFINLFGNWKIDQY